MLHWIGDCQREQRMWYHTNLTSQYSIQNSLIIVILSCAPSIQTAADKRKHQRDTLLLDNRLYHDTDNHKNIILCRMIIKTGVLFHLFSQTQMESFSQVLYCSWTTFKARETRVLIQEFHKDHEQPSSKQINECSLVFSLKTHMLQCLKIQI